ncbi:unnamed protein product [Mycena citricolor]|uniref:Uncharacterized protein n=1 Tax=Mycena citricolor TaxID=2018698 RepID=A0AAD2H137_9AGAR|nr:unnamed protein product [Mycena citricolor]
MPMRLPAPDWTLALQGRNENGWKARNQLEVEIEELKAHLRQAEVQSAMKDPMLEEVNATMVLQNITLKKTNEALHQREERATNERACMFKGQAQCLSSDEFFEEVQRMNREKQEKDAEKSKRKAVQNNRKAAKAALDKEWAQMKAVHAADVEAWGQECRELIKGGSWKKDLPVKPKLGKKPQLPQLEDDTDNNNDNDNDVDQEEGV